METKTVITALVVIVALFLAYRLITNYNGNKRRIFEYEDDRQVDRVIYQQPRQVYYTSPNIVSNPLTSGANGK